jgi:hypothetical protein
MVTPETTDKLRVPLVARSFTGVVEAAGPTIWKPGMDVATLGVVVALLPAVKERLACAPDGMSTEAASTEMPKKNFFISSKLYPAIRKRHTYKTATAITKKLPSASQSTH